MSRSSTALCTHPVAVCMQRAYAAIDAALDAKREAAAAAAAAAVPAPAPEPVNIDADIINYSPAEPVAKPEESEGELTVRLIELFASRHCPEQKDALVEQASKAPVVAWKAFDGTPLAERAAPYVAVSDLHHTATMSCTDCVLVVALRCCGSWVGAAVGARPRGNQQAARRAVWRRCC